MSNIKIERSRKAYLTRVLQGLLLVLLLSLLGVVLWGRSTSLGGFRMFAVTGSSMEPTIPVGAMVITRGMGEYETEDIVTRAQEDGTLVTHRIVASDNFKGNVWYRLRGDKNRSNDFEFVTSDSVVGRVEWIVPYVGYGVAAMKTRWGIVVMLVVPAVLLATKEVETIQREWRLRNKNMMKGSEV